jgi:hypothetical protein
MTIITQNTTKGKKFEATREGIKVVATILFEVHHD